MVKTAVLIPCYNEEKRLALDEIKILLSRPGTTVFLANDGSTDNTLRALETIKLESSDRIQIFDFERNSGKANTVYLSMNRIYDLQQYDYLGYVDADFSTSANQINKMLEILEGGRHQFLFGSRIKLLNSKINRKWYRHIIGRVIVTIIDFRTRLRIYDTQCGAKFFHASLIPIGFSERFLTSWLFDVEVFVRLRKAAKLNSGLEYPLDSWNDVAGSKLSLWSGFKIAKEIYLILKIAK
jgi:glycosyltransferase involved in cell wall biosynthesis